MCVNLICFYVQCYGLQSVKRNTHSIYGTYNTVKTHAINRWEVNAILLLFIEHIIQLTSAFKSAMWHKSSLKLPLYWKRNRRKCTYVSTVVSMFSVFIYVQLGYATRGVPYFSLPEFSSPAFSSLAFSAPPFLWLTVYMTNCKGLTCPTLLHVIRCKYL